MSNAYLGSVPETLMTVRDVAHFLRVSEAWVYRNSRSGALPTIRVGRARRFSRAEIAEWIRSQQDGCRALPGHELTTAERMA